MARTPALVQLSDDLIARLDARAAAARRSRSDLIREAIERYLTDDPGAAVDESYTRAGRAVRRARRGHRLRLRRLGRRRRDG